MLYLLYGPDGYSSRQRTYDTLTALANPDMAGMDVIRLDGALCHWRDVIDACTVLPFLSLRQIVVLKGFITAAAQRKKKASTDADALPPEPISPASSTADAERRYPTPQQWGTFLASLPETTHLLIWEDDISTTNAFLKALQALPPQSLRTTYSAPLNGQDLTQWLQQYAAQRQVRLAGPVIGLLIQAHASDLWAQANELDKLCAAVGPGGTVTSQIFENLVTVTAEATVYAFADALFGGRVPQALQLAQALHDQGIAPEYVLAALNGRLRDSVMGSAGQAKAGRPARFTPKPPLAPGVLIKAYDTLVAADRILKTASTDERAGVLDYLVVELGVYQR